MLLQAQMRNGLYGNEWINHQQTYFKIKVHTDGLHRLNASALAAAGINLSRPSQEFQLYHLGAQVPLYVHAPNGQIEYMEFYGRRNRGELDGSLYNNPNHQINPEYSLINDTAAYFLSWAASGGRQFGARVADLTNLPAPQPFFMHRSLQVYSDVFSEGKVYVAGGVSLSKSSMEFGEGYCRNASTNHSLSIPSPHLASGGTTASLRFSYYCRAFSQHQLEVRIGGQSQFSSNFFGDSVGVVNFSFPASRVQSGSTSINIRGNAGSNDSYFLGYVELEYPRLFNFDGQASFAFRLAPSATRQYLEISNINSSGANTQNIYLYDLTNNLRIQCFWDGSRVLTDLPPSSQVRDLVLVNQAAPGAVLPVPRLEQVQFTDFRQQFGDYVIVSHPQLYRNSQGADPVLEYAAYRASTGFSPIVVDVNELYDQFAYGIAYHPLALRNFAHFAVDEWATAPQYLFIIGKGRPYINARVSRPADLLVPTFGYPPSDNVLLARIGSDAPVVAVGRLAATSGDQVSLYLQKMRDVEAWDNALSTAEARAWRKRVLHLGGGANSLEQNSIRNSLNIMKQLIEGPNYGGQVSSFFKNSSAPIQAAQSAYLDSLINTGLSLITFFGHSSANSFDFNLDYPENYQNYQKYPMIMALGCYGGTIWEPFQGISERFVFEQDAGSIVFFASTGAASLSSLGLLGQNFYSNATGGSYGKGAGHAYQQSIRQAQASNTYNAFTQIAYQYMTYHGDPAYDLHAQLRPDYFIDQSSVSHSPSTVTTQMNDFTLALDVRNLGQAMDTVFQVEITREFPNGTTAFVAQQQVRAPYYADTLRFQVPVGGAQALGINYFNIRIDALSEIAERPNPAAEQNNEVLRYAVAISSEAIIPVYPYEFAIVPHQNIELRASTGNAFAPAQNYVFQIDTTAYFNSPLRQQGIINSSGGVVTWTPNLNYLDSTVYYWRVSRDSTGPQNGYQWEESSFIYLAGSFPGWNQSHYFQYKRDQFQNLVLEEPNRRFEFRSSVQEIFLRNGFSPNPLNPELLAVYLNGGLVDKCNCPSSSGVVVQVINPQDLSFWTLAGGASRYGAINCDPNTSRSSTYHLFRTLQAGARTDLERFIRDTVPTGHYVLLFSLNNAYPHLFHGGLISALQEQGAWYLNDWVQSQGAAPFAFFFEKGDTNFVGKKTVIGGGSNDIIQLSGLIPGNWDNGFVRSTLIGPAARWGSMHWRSLEEQNHDRLYLDLYGIDANGLSQLIWSNVQSRDTLLNSISAQQYPYLQMVWHTKDSVLRSSPQLRYWRILADELPEAALDPRSLLVFQSDTLDQGMNVVLKTAMRNIGRVNMDSMLVKFQVLGNPNLVAYQRLAPLLTGDTLQAQVSFPTASLQGQQQLMVEINPDNDQPEQYHFNNIGLLSFLINRDKVNPLLDVTFDGRHIMNGDLVSAKPEILITLSDDNRYLALNRLEDFTIILRHPSFPNGELPLNSSTTSLQFFPADSSQLGQQNKAKILIRPSLDFDGRYTLYLSAKDRSGNNSGALNYSVEFEVINKPSISQVFNYPNPFTTQTQFVFTLTGSELPDELLIQIYTIRGTVVKEIRLQDLGTLRIGLNRTEYAWDGTDQFGDRLANGVYLYRVQARKNGRDYELYRGRKDYLFQQGFGKMYLMR